MCFTALFIDLDITRYILNHILPGEKVSFG